MTRVAVYRLAVVVFALSAPLLPGCAVERGQQSAWTFVDDAVITSIIKARFVDSRQVDALAIGVETLHGTVMLSGFALTRGEKEAAENIARSVDGVVLVKSQLLVSP